jgi:NAD(P)H dehydrogenase (quinone)
MTARMNVFILTAHPDQESFNARLSRAAASRFTSMGAQVVRSDLYAMNFDPREDAGKFPRRLNASRFFVQDEQRFNHGNGTLTSEVSQEIERLLWSDLLIVQFPLWWFGVPAILKGWMDRVFVYGGMYSSKRRFETGVCRGKRVLICATTGSSEADCSPTGREGDTRLILWPTLYSFRYIGFDVLEPFLLYGVGGADGPDRRARERAMVERFEALLARVEAIPVMPFNGSEDWDADGQLRPGAPSYSPFIGRCTVRRG